MELIPWRHRADIGHINTYQRTPQGVERVDLSSLPAQDQPERFSPQAVTPEFLQGTLAELKNSAGRQVSPPMAKDNSCSTKAMYMGYDPADKRSLDFIAQMAMVGRVEGFRVEADARPGEAQQIARGLPQEAAGNVTVLTNPGGHDAWTEDHGEFTERGEVVIPALLPDTTPLDDWSIEDRSRRYFEAEKLGHPRPRCDYSVQGLTNERQAQQELVSSGLATHATGLKMATSYVEGGNLLNGHRPDGQPYALVGKDSLAITRHLLRDRLHREVSLDEARAQIAQDYGLQPAQVVPVEQPGEFHLDMDMALAGPGQVILNDSRRVAELQHGWISEHYRHKWIGRAEERDEQEKVDQFAERRARYEDLVAQDLTAAGLQVFRVPACFPASPANPAMNFLNLREGRNQQGQAYAVALGGSEPDEKAFAEELLTRIPAGFERVHFLDRQLSEGSLKYKGGIKCRTKPRSA